MERGIYPARSQPLALRRHCHWSLAAMDDAQLLQAANRQHVGERCLVGLLVGNAPEDMVDSLRKGNEAPNSRPLPVL